MTTCRRGPLTERILQIIGRKRLFQGHVADLAGIDREAFYRRVHDDRWTYAEVCDIATALGERVDVLLDVTSTL